MTPGDWLGAAVINLRRLPAQYWIVLAFIYSGKAMVMFLPAGMQGGAAIRLILDAATFLILFWLPYVLMRVMAEEDRPARPTLAFAIFTVAAILLAVLRAMPAMAAHQAFLQGIGLHYPELVMLGAGVLSAVLVARFLPLYAGTATAQLSPFERHWWRGMNGVAAGFVGAVLIVELARQTADLLLPIAMPLFTLKNILLSHAAAFTDAGVFLFTLGLAVAACRHASGLQGASPPR
ncbi:MAG: hypothetical protein WA979_05160 [Pacificimonas sp.]